MRSTSLQLMAALLVSALAVVAAEGPPSQRPLPLPDAPVRVVISDPAAFDAALAGSFRKALTAEIGEEDRLAAGWRRTRVGTKLDDQWSRLAKDLPWTWDSLRKLKPRSVGLALLQVGHLEAVMVVETSLAVLPITPPAGKALSHGGVAYSLVAQGAADSAEDPDRRMGLAWARSGDRLFLATSERALLLALDEHLAGRGFAPPLPGLVSLELDLDALRKDRYFRREFLFGEGPETGRVRAALRAEEGRLVEVREGSGDAGHAASTFEVKGAVAAAWEPDAGALAAALRAALLEPIPTPPDRPVPAVAPLPQVDARQQDRYLVSLDKPRLVAGEPAFEEGELVAWRELFRKQPVEGWGWALAGDGARRVVFPWPEASQAELLDLCRATVERRAGHAAVVEVGGASEVRVGPELPVVALRRTGAFVWIGPSARDLAEASEPHPGGDVLRWARLDLDAARREARRWEKAEGPEAPEETRAFSDRILGLLGWIPQTRAISVERRKAANGWTERVVFETARR
jgi:hypothetical protein